MYLVLEWACFLSVVLGNSLSALYVYYDTSSVLCYMLSMRLWLKYFTLSLCRAAAIGSFL